MNFHQKLVVYYILDYFGILFILDINFVLIEFILWDQRLSKGSVLRNILWEFSLLINIENIYSVLLVSLLILSRYAWLVHVTLVTGLISWLFDIICRFFLQGQRVKPCHLLFHLNH